MTLIRARAKQPSPCDRPCFPVTRTTSRETKLKMLRFFGFCREQELKELDALNCVTPSYSWCSCLRGPAAIQCPTSVLHKRHVKLVKNPQWDIPRSSDGKQDPSARHFAGPSCAKAHVLLPTSLLRLGEQSRHMDWWFTFKLLLWSQP